MVTIHLVLLVGAAICFLLSTINIPARISLQSLGLLLWVLAVLLTGVPVH